MERKTMKRALVGTSITGLLFLIAFNSSAIISMGIAGFEYLRGNGSTAPQNQTGSVVLNVFDGQRRLVAPGTKLLVRIIDGNQKFIVDRYYDGPSIRFDGLPFYDNFGDNYTIIVWTDGYKQAGFTPVKISNKPEEMPVLDLMLLPSKNVIDFSDASFDALKLANSPVYFLLLSADAEPVARARWEALMKNDPLAAICILNIATSLLDAKLGSGSPVLPFVRSIIFDADKEKPSKSRFFGYADKRLSEELNGEVKRGTWQADPGSFVFHPGSTASFREKRFGEANMQVTFFENDTKVIDGVTCVKVEIDIDYYRDPAAHAILEVLPHLLTGGASDPVTVYQLRWIAGRRSGNDFAPPYRILEQPKPAKKN
ncbi:MAG: hypothetical protein IT343_21625 [Candidatus Melainabacteria bacterium]|jgi:hypothetical protein|nr:hypothetical protein [Candidatus Melainabacteria bacterium]